MREITFTVCRLFAFSCLGSAVGVLLMMPCELVSFYIASLIGRGVFLGK